MENKTDVVATLRSYKKLTENEKNHQQLLKDKTIILYTATLLDSQNLYIIELCLNIIEDFVQNDSTHPMLVSTFGIFEALESVSIRLRTSDSRLANKSSDMVDILRKTAPPAYSTRLRTKGKNPRKTTVMYQLYIPNLSLDNRLELEETLIQIKGLISFVVDLEQQRCTIRVGPKVTLKSIIVKISEKCGMKALVVTKHPGAVSEAYVDIMSSSNKTLPCPDYFPEDETPPKGKSLTNITNLTKNAEGWLKSAADFWNKSFYW